MTNGLAAPGELSLTRNWAADDPVLDELETAYEMMSCALLRSLSRQVTATPSLLKCAKTHGLWQRQAW